MQYQYQSWQVLPHVSPPTVHKKINPIANNIAAIGAARAAQVWVPHASEQDGFTAFQMLALRIEDGGFDAVALNTLRDVLCWHAQRSKGVMGRWRTHELEVVRTLDRDHPLGNATSWRALVFKMPAGAPPLCLLPFPRAVWHALLQLWHAPNLILVNVLDFSRAKLPLPACTHCANGVLTLSATG